MSNALNVQTNRFTFIVDVVSQYQREVKVFSDLKKMGMPKFRVASGD